MGNTLVMKIPTVGGLAHVLTMEAYASCLPPGILYSIKHRQLGRFLINLTRCGELCVWTWTRDHGSNHGSWC
jgi:hypothetical protein